jgi:hypothetical protein
MAELALEDLYLCVCLQSLKDQHVKRCENVFVFAFMLKYVSKVWIYVPTIRFNSWVLNRIETKFQISLYQNCISLRSYYD